MPAIHIIPVLRDNYCYIIEGGDKQCLIVDPGEADPIKSFIQQHKLVPVTILNTHHHADHTAGNSVLKSRFNVQVIGPESERHKIPALDQGVKDSDIIDLACVTLNVIHTPGHTNGHVVFYVEQLSALFCGDTLFSMGCGRLLEGTADDMFASLQKIKSLPPETQIYCGHEYTAANAAFAIATEPDNADIKTRMDDVQKKRANNLPTLPVTLETELKTNPFLRAEDAKKFAELRLRKDNF